MSESTPMPQDDQIRAWASEWADKFDQSCKEETLRGWIGKTVRGERAAISEEDGPKGFEGVVIGFSIDRVFYRPEEEAENQEVARYSLILGEGLQVAILAGMNVSEVSVE